MVTANAACTACVGSTFQAEADSVNTCVDCGGSCLLGTWLESSCTADADRVCTNCTLPENAQLTAGVTYTCEGNETAVAAAPFPQQTLTLEGGVEIAGGDGTDARTAFEQSFKDDLSAKLLELGLDVDPKYIEITGVTVGSINVEYKILAPIAAFANATAALTALATQAAAGTLSIGGATAAATQGMVTVPDMSTVPSPCKQGFSLVAGSGVCASNLCGADERVSNNMCVACDQSAVSPHNQSLPLLVRGTF